MNTNSIIYKAGRGLLASFLAAALVACGGGGGGGGDDVTSEFESVVSRGVITQLGSIWVNGCRYVSTAGGRYGNDDDDSASFDDYQVGQVVSVRGSRHGGTSCVADEVEYEAEIEGTVVGGKINQITIIMGSTVPSGTTLTEGLRYEVSGIWIDDSTIEATFVKPDDDGDGEDEIKGFVQTIHTPNLFELRGITFTYGGSPVLAQGDYIEVHFNPTTCSGVAPDVACTATEVEFEDDFFDGAEDGEIEIEGAILVDISGCPDGSDFRIDMTCIDWNSRTEWEDGLASAADLAPGLRVEAEGHMIDGKLVADEIKGRGNRVRISSFAEAKAGVADAGSFKLVDQNIDVEVVGGITQFEDLATFDNLDTPNYRLEVRGLRTGPKSMLAIRVKIEDDNDDKLDEHEVRAEVDVDGANVSGPSITVMGITSTADGNTQLELDDDIPYPGTLNDFLAEIDDNDDATDGPRDIVEVRIDSSAGFYAEQIEVEEEDD